MGPSPSGAGPTTGLVVRRVRPGDGPALRQLRLAALATDPLAFGSTLEREEALPEAHWSTLAENGASGSREATFVAVGTDAAPVGMIGAFTEGAARHLWGMWVVPARRRGGAGRALLRAVLEWCAEAAPGEPVRLDVNPVQEAAIRLYVAHGFRTSGEDQPLGHHEPSFARPMERSGGPGPRPA